MTTWLNHKMICTEQHMNTVGNSKNGAFHKLMYIMTDI